MRGFGFQYDTTTGRSRSWYCGADGIKRWADNDQPCEETGQSFNTSPTECSKNEEKRT